MSSTLGKRGAEKCLPGKRFDAAQMGVLGRRDQGDGDAGFAGAAGAADAMDVDFHFAGQVVIKHMGDVVNVETARGDVGGDENLNFIVAKAIQDALAGFLGEIAVQSFGREIPVAVSAAANSAVPMRVRAKINARLTSSFSKIRVRAAILSDGRTR